MTQAGSIVAFDVLGAESIEPRKLYGQVYCLLEGDLTLIVTPDGCSYIVYGWGLHAPGERDVWGRVFWPPWTSEQPVESDPEYVRGATNELLRRPALQRALARIIRNRDRHVKGPKQRHDAVEDAWEIPTHLSVNRGGYNELSGYFLAYLDRERDERKTEEAALNLLKSGKARRGSEKQYEVMLACYYGTLPMSWLADAWGVNRSVVHHMYRKAIEFISLYAPIDTERHRSPHREKTPDYRTAAQT